MKKLVLLCLTLFLSTLMFSQNPPQKRPQILVLGTYHMDNPGRDIFNMKADDVLAPERQKEMAELIEALKKFHPTKIAIESEVGSKRTPKEYSDFLAGKYQLTRNEIDQIGYRLAKELGHKQIYPVDEEGDFPMGRVEDFAKAKGKDGDFQQVMNRLGDMVKRQDAYVKSHTILQSLLYMNSDQRVAEDVGYYFAWAHMGSPDDYAGPDLLASWYQRNARIYNNIVNIIESPDDRVLVIYGAGHLGWLRQDIANDPTLQLRKLSEFVPEK